MSNLHRIQWIDMHIREKRYPNCRTIAEEFCISRRQASWDVEYLRYSLNAPVEYSPEHNGYFYTDETYHLPSIIISRQEKEMLSYLADQYKHQGSEMALRLADLFTRLGGSTGESNRKNEPIIPVYTMNRKEIYCIRNIESAVHEKKKIKINYIDSGNVLSTRIVHPYILFMQSNKHYLAAYCELREEERVFRVSRIKQVRIRKQNFALPPGFNPDKYREHYIFHYRLPYQAEVLFDNPVDVENFALPAKNLGDQVYRISFRTSQELISQLVGCCVTFQIIKPGWVKDKLNSYFTHIINKNR